MLLHSRHIRPAASAPPQDQRLGFVLAAASLSMFIVNLDFFALNLSIPAMAEDRRLLLVSAGPRDETRSCGHPDPRISA